MNEKQTPLIDLLRAVPADACMTYEHSEHHHQMIPAGRLCHEAAEALSAHRHAEAELERCRVQLAGCGVVANGNTREAIERNTLPTDAYGYSASYASCLLAAQREVEERERAERAEAERDAARDDADAAIAVLKQQLATARTEIEALRKDAERFHWLTDDLTGEEKQRRDLLLCRLPVMSTSAARLDIDAARGKNDNITTSSE